MPINPDKIAVMQEGFFTPRFDIYDRNLEGPVVQMGITLQHFTGDIYIKVEHLEFIAREHLGMVTQEAMELLRGDYDALVRANAGLREQVEELKSEGQELFDARLDNMLASYVNSRKPNDDVPPVANVPSSPEVPAANGAKGKSKEANINL